MNAKSSPGDPSTLTSTSLGGAAGWGKYRIVRPLKVGGTASIYLAVMRGENAFSREVVVKRPLPHLVAEGRARLMFVDEAHIAARLQHPNVCQVLDLVSREDEVYLVLEYLRGVDLREIIKDCIRRGVHLPTELSVWMAVEMASGLHFAHEAKGLDAQPLNLVHRDVSPKNIRITFEGSVKLIDFGIARADNRATETAAGTIKGTLGYMSPEQILGDAVDRRSDVFAFGICLFQMLTRKNPFDGANLAERVRRLTLDPIPGIRSYRPELPPELEDIVGRCLARPRDERYATMSDVRADLEGALARLGAVSPRAQLVAWLQTHFAKARDDTDVDLASALTAAAQTLDPIDPSIRLTFPDDAPSAPSARPTGPTFTPPPSEQNTEAEAAGETRPLEVVGALAEPARDRPRWPFLALFAAAVTVSTAVLVWSLGSRLDPAPVRAVAVSSAERVREAPVAPPPSAPKTKTRRAPASTPDPKAPSPAAQGPRAGARVSSAGARAEAGSLPQGRDGARLYFRAGLARARLGRPDEARLLYELSYLEAEPSPPSSLYLNLGLLAREQEDVSRARSCLEAYLRRRPGAANASRIRAALEALPQAPARRCVSEEDAARARRRRVRSGAAVRTWLDAALKDGLQ